MRTYWYENCLKDLRAMYHFEERIIPDNREELFFKKSRGGSYVTFRL